MKEKIEKRIEELKTQEQHLIQEIGQFEKAIMDRKATLLSIRGGIIERQLMIEELSEEE